MDVNGRDVTLTAGEVTLGAQSTTPSPAGEAVGITLDLIEPRLAEQRAELGLGALAGAEQQQHVQVHPDRRGLVLRALREDRVDDEHARVLGHRGADGGEDAQRVSVVPVVQDAAEQVGVGAGRDGVEEVADDALGPVVEVRPGSFDGGRAIDERRVDVRAQRRGSR